MSSFPKVSVLGCGAFGTAIAHLLASNGCQVNLWSFEKDVEEQINQLHENRKYLPNAPLPHNLHATSDLFLCLEAEIVFEAIPVKFLRSILVGAKERVKPNQLWVVCSKGIEQETYLFPSQIIDSVFEQKSRVAVLSGPSFAREIVEKALTGVTVAVREADGESRNQLSQVLTADYFILDFNTDLLGVQVGGALKNVIALSLGLAAREKLADNTRALLLTQGLKEMKVFAQSIGASTETLDGLSGFGDLLLTTTGSLSKNFHFAQEFSAKLKTSASGPTEAQPEGVNTIQSVRQMMKKLNIRLPLMEMTYEVLFEGREFADVTTTLQQVYKINHHHN